MTSPTERIRRGATFVRAYGPNCELRLLTDGYDITHRADGRHNTTICGRRITHMFAAAEARCPWPAQRCPICFPTVPQEQEDL